MRKYGFKLFSSNLHDNPRVLDESIKFVFEHRDRMFIELMVVPNTAAEDFEKLKLRLKGVEVRLHAPHHMMNFDVGNRELEASNRKIFENVQFVADLLNAKTVVVHAGCRKENAPLKETVRQFRLFDDERIVVENLPVVAEEGLKLSGNTPEEIAFIKENCGCGFCFDFSHALCAANSLGLDVEKQLQGFFDLKPDVYHLCDGLVDEIDDKHLHYGKGNYPLEHFLNDYTSNNAYITMETGRGLPVEIKPWADDFEFLLKIEN
ncbi:MAG: hypothetical protein J6Y53_04755 [Alphaproteobacteria bacterium]|nr:hypothetical protein [Alphaproteobacteria bacterium]